MLSGSFFTNGVPGEQFNASLVSQETGAVWGVIGTRQQVTNYFDSEMSEKCLLHVADVETALQ
jgi:hypothetical protein